MFLCACVRNSDSDVNPIDAPFNKGQNDQFDPVTVPLLDDGIPLNKRQRFLLTKNWKAINRDLEEAGAELFVNLFETHPDMHENFKFKGLHGNPRDEQKQHEKLREHGEGVMMIFDQAVTNIENADALYKGLDRIALGHSKKKGFDPEFFRTFEKPFLTAVQQILGDRYTDNMAEIYAIFISLVLNYLTEKSQSLLNKES